MVKVSVIIPTYNGDRYIDRAIASVRDSTYRDWELIVIDDGSQDNTRQLLQSYPNPIHYIEQDNQGVAAARNRGLASAQGEFIAFLDQDDFFLPEKLSLQVALLESQASLGFVSSGWEIAQESGKPISAVRPWLEMPKLNLQGIVIWKPVFLGAMLFRRFYLELAGGFNTQLQQTSDVDLVLRLASLNCRADWVKQVTVVYRQHDRNVSRNTVEQAKELELVLDGFFTTQDLSSAIKNCERESRYQTAIWSAWRLYYTGHYEAAISYLEKALIYRDRCLTEVILSWCDRLKKYTQEYGEEFNLLPLINSQNWQQFLNKCIQ